MKLKFQIKGLDCANCTNELERAVQKLEEVTNVSISFLTQKMQVECKDVEQEIIVRKIKETVKKKEPDVEITLL